MPEPDPAQTAIPDQDYTTAPAQNETPPMQAPPQQAPVLESEPVHEPIGGMP